MKTFKIIAVIFAVLIAAGFSKANAQAVQDKALSWTDCFYSECANNGNGEWICGTLIQHAVFRYNKDGSLKSIHCNYIESEFIGQSSGEVFTFIGASKGDFVKFPFGFNETAILSGDKGTKVVIKTKFHVISEVEIVWELFFEKCS